MPKKLFVGGLPWATTEHELRQVFEAFGAVLESIVIRDRRTMRSRGFGFVSFADDSHGQAAMLKMNGTQFEGRTIKVSETDERASRLGTSEVQVQPDRRSQKLRPARPNHKAKERRHKNWVRFSKVLRRVQKDCRFSNMIPTFEVPDNLGRTHSVGLSSELLNAYCELASGGPDHTQKPLDETQVLKAHLILTLSGHGEISAGQSMKSILEEWSVNIEVFKEVEKVFNLHHKPSRD